MRSLRELAWGLFNHKRFFYGPGKDILAIAKPNVQAAANAALT
jgi:hypothetical protein